MPDTVIEAEAADVLRVWIDETGPEGWYKPDPDLDEWLRARFGTLIGRAATGRLASWLAAPREALALLILLDQFPRNVFRGSARAYAADRRALGAAHSCLSRGLDLAVPEPERQFFYLPLMHSESLAQQDRCVRLVMLRLPRTGADNLDHARRHREVIRRFGRFPSRNRALGRPDTGAELRYRAEGGYMS